MDGPDLTAEPTTAPTRRQTLLRALTTGGLVGLGLVAGGEIYNASFGGNLHEVIPGAVYRCGQPTPSRLAWFVKKYGIRTVVNLRGCCAPSPWYLEESQASVALDLSQEDLPFSAGRLPSVPGIRELVNVLDHSDRPLLIHCHQGIDRTGMASALSLLLYTDSSLDTALQQLGLRYGHLAYGRTGNIDRFFELYREWLAAHSRTHTSATFRDWVEHAYCPGECASSLEVLELDGKPLVVGKNEPSAVRVRCTNTSVKPWRFRPGANAGIHLIWRLLRPENDACLCHGQAGLFHAEVAPGSSIDLTVALPSLPEAGSFRLQLDLADEQHARFHQLGPEPFEVELEVR